jgi:hypothetical protein
MPGVRPMICDTCQSGPLANYYSVDGVPFCPDCYECDDLRAGITRAETDLPEARRMAVKMYHLACTTDGEHEARDCPWMDL